jgi:hypothetical protein
LEKYYEAEYPSLSEISRETTWIRNLMKELGHEQTVATVVNQDNTCPISWAKGIGNFRKNKHVDIKIHLVRELIKQVVIDDAFVPVDRHDG